MTNLWQFKHFLFSGRTAKMVQGRLLTGGRCVPAPVWTRPASGGRPCLLLLPLRPAGGTAPLPLRPAGGTAPPPLWARGLQHGSPARPDGEPERPALPLSQRQRLKLAVRDYGATVIVFHVTISLASLGFFYLAVKSGLDVVALLRWVGLGDSLAQSQLVSGGSTFVLAYAVHKVFAPARIATTLGCTPLIVRALRRRGLLRTPAPRGD